MNVREQIQNYIASQPEPKREDMQKLNALVLKINPRCKLWFLDGKNDKGKVVSNPNIGYGSREHKYADGSISEFYQIGLTATSSGISIYIMGIEDKKYLAATYGKDLGKATVTGYCIRFKSLNDIDVGVLESAIRFGFEKRTEEIA
jgi:hypothetical protein